VIKEKLPLSMLVKLMNYIRWHS